MKQIDHKDTIISRANLRNYMPSTDHTDCELCEEELLFAMQENDHTFSIGLKTVLKCLELAEAEGYVPKLSNDWWISVMNRHK